MSATRPRRLQGGVHPPSLASTLDAAIVAACLEGAPEAAKRWGQGVDFAVTQGAGGVFFAASRNMWTRRAGYVVSALKGVQAGPALPGLGGQEPGVVLPPPARLPAWSIPAQHGSVVDVWASALEDSGKEWERGWVSTAVGLAGKTAGTAAGVGVLG